MNTTHVEHDALTALRAELTTAAGRRIRRRRTRRRTVVVLAVIALLLAATAATAALIHSSTGVPAVDKLLDVENRPGARPGPGAASPPLVVPEGDRRTNVVAYLTQAGTICVVSADLEHRGSFGGCPSLAYLNRRIRRRGAYWFGGSYGLEQRTNELMVAGAVRSIRPRGPGDWRVSMTPPWTPPVRRGRALRLVVVIDDADMAGPTGDIPPEAHEVPPLELTYSDGHTRVFRGP